MRVRRLVFALLIIALSRTTVGIAQDLPPEVLLLARMKAHMRDSLAQLPNYTCLETINRFYRPNARESMKPLDTVRLEVIYTDHHEWYGSPGDKDLGVSNPATFVGSGLMGNGTFAIALSNILTAAHFDYQGKEPLGDRPAVRYDFQFARQPNAFQISMVGGSGTVGEKGSIWFDEQSLDILRFEAQADDIPDYLPLAGQNESVSYARVQIGSAMALLAQRAEMRLVENAGADNLDHFEFTNCRAYSAESTISFNAEAPQFTTEASNAHAPAENYFLPALLRVSLRLMTPIANTDPVGKLIEARVSGDVSYKGKVVIRDGALVRGRIRRLEHYEGKATGRADVTGDYIVGLEFTEVAAVAGAAPFYADVLSMDKIPWIRPSLGERVSAGNVKITLPELPGVASVFCSGGDVSVACRIW